MFRLTEFVSVAAPKGFAGLLTVFLNIVLLRYFGPEQFGAYSFCVAAILLADGVLGSGIDLGVLRLAPAYRATDRERSYQVEAAAFGLKVAVMLPLLLALPLIANPLSQKLLGPQGDASLLYLTGWGAAGMLVLRSALVHAQVEGRFHLYGVLEWLHLGLKFGGIALLLVLHEVSPRAVLWLFVAGPFAALLFWFLTGKMRLAQVWPVRAQVVYELLAFVKWSVLTFAFAAVVSRMDLFLLAILSSIHEVGIFSGGQVFASIPELIGTYLAIVLSPRVMPYFREGRFYPFFRRFQLACFGGCLLILVLALVAMKGFLTALIPPSFSKSSEVFLILLPGALAGLATFPLTLSFLMFVRPRFLFLLDCVTAPLMVAAYIYLIPAYGAVGAAWVTSVARFAKAAIAQAAAWKYARRSPESLTLSGGSALVMDPRQGSA